MKNYNEKLISLVLLIILFGMSATAANIANIPMGPQNINVWDNASFMVNITNNDAVNYTDYKMVFSYNFSVLNLTSFQTTNPSIVNGPFFNVSLNQVMWSLNLTPGQNLMFFINLTALQLGNGIISAALFNETGTMVVNSNQNLNVVSGVIDPGNFSGGNGNYTSMWTNSIPATNFSDLDLFDFMGAPYVARGPGCGFSDFNSYGNSTPGQGCNNQMSGLTGSVSLDLGAVWVDQNADYIAWNIVGPFQLMNNLSMCNGQSDDDSAYVIEFDVDDNQSTGCIGNPQSGEGCYPGSDYQIWYFPDTHRSLFAEYNGSSYKAGTDGQLTGGNCSANSGGVCFVADTSVDIMVNVTCGFDSNATTKAGMKGLVIVVNKSALPSNVQLNFETNSFNYSQPTGPIDMLSNWNGNKTIDSFVFMGPGKDAGACYQYDHINQSACETNPDGLKCKWKSFSGNPSDGICDPDFKNFVEGTACFTYNNESGCQNSPLGNCKWDNSPFAKNIDPNGMGLCIELFNPNDFGGSGSCDTDCFSCFSKTQCGNSNANGGSEYGGCSWYNDTFNPQGWCDAKGKKFGCSQTPNDCFDQTSCENANWNWSTTWNVCKKDSNTEICFNGVDDNNNGLVDCAESYCQDTAKFCGAGMDTLTGTYQGMSQEEAQMMKLIGANPAVINLRIDNLADSTSLSDAEELYGFSVVVSNLGLGMGVGLKNGSDLLACGGNSNTTKYIYFLDNDANVNTGCNITIDSVVHSGFDYLIKYGDHNTVNSTANSTKQIYACYNNNWIQKDGAIITPTGGDPMNPGPVVKPMECGENNDDPYAPSKPIEEMFVAAVVVEKADVGNPKNDMKFLVAVINGSWNDLNNLKSYDLIDDIYYTPGSMEFQPIDCFKEPTKCGSEFAILGGGKFMPSEDCMMPNDEDMDGLTNCADPDCGYAPNCQGNIGKFNISADKTAPKVKMSKVDTFDQGAFVMWNTNEPTNGTLNFYYNSSTCSIINTTLWDEGMPGVSFDDFRPWHNIPLDSYNLGYNLVSNTTYYYKLVSKDQNNNPSISKCLNFTTEANPKNVTMKFDFQPKQGDGFFSNLSIEINGQKQDMGSYLDKTDLQDVNLTFSNPNANESNNWSIELVGADIFQNFDMNFSDAFLANNTGEKGDFLGMGNSKWLETAQSLGVDYVNLKIPVEGDSLFHCYDNGTECVDVTNTSGVEKIENGTGFSKWKVPLTLGFSSYSVGGGESLVVYNVSFVNTTSSIVSAATDTNTSILINITNLRNESDVYNFSLNEPSGGLGWINGSSTGLDNITIASNASIILNITINGNYTGSYDFNLTATLYSNASIVLSSVDDMIIRLIVPDNIPPTWNVAPSNQTVEYASEAVNFTLNATDVHSLPIIYSINDSANFLVDSSTGVVTNNGLIAIGLHQLTVYANDSSENSISASINVTVQDTTNLNWTQVPSNQNANYNLAFIYDVNATDQDGNVGEGSTFTYALSDNASGNFTIDASSGVITNATIIDFYGVVSINITVTDSASNEIWEVINITVSDLIDPVTTDDYDNLWKNSDFNVTLSATDGGSGVSYINYSVDGGAFVNTTGTSAKALITAEGVYNLTYFAVDVFGNVESNNTVIVKLDKTMPVYVRENAWDGWINNPGNVAIWSRDLLSNVTNITYSFDGGANASLDISWDAGSSYMIGAIYINTSGNHSITYYSIDGAGNPTLINVTYAALDIINPLTNLSGNTTWWVSNNVNLTFTTGDSNSGVNYTQYNVDSAGWINGTWVFFNVSGNYTVEYRSVDNVGNVEATKSTNVLLDLVDPVTTASNVPNVWSNTSVNISFSVLDANSGLDYTNYSVDAGANITADYVVFSSTGNFRLDYYSVDLAGNIEITKTVNILVDMIAPNSSDDYIGSGWESNSVVITVSSDDNNSGVNRTVINGQSRTSINISTSGNNSVAYYAVDNAGNTEAANTIYVAVDLDKPTIVRNSPLATSDVNETINITLADAHSGLNTTSWTIDFNGTSVVSGNVNATLSNGVLVYINENLSEGVYLVSASVKDLVGIVSDTLSWNMTVDLTAPTVSSFTLSSSVVNVGASLTSSCVGVDNLDSNPSEVVTGVSTASAGSKTATCTVTDAAGNTAILTTTYTVNAVSSSSGSGGSGGGSSAGLSQNYQSNIINEILVGATTSISFDRISLDITGIELNVNKNKSNIKIIAKSLDSKPLNLPSVNNAKNVFKYLEIIHDLLNNDEITQAKITFKVPKSWFVSNSENPEDIMLYRFTTSWDELKTNLIGLSGDDYEFEALTPGMSYFAIGVKEAELVVVPTEESIANITDNESIVEVIENSITEENISVAKEIPVEKSKKGFAILIAAIVIVIILVGLFLVFGGKGGFKKSNPKIAIKKFYLEKKKSGKSDEEIIQELINAGWKKEIINEVVKKNN